MNEFAKSVAQIRTESPFPWVSLEAGMGLIRVLDAEGKEVPLFRVLALMAKLTAHLASTAPKSPVQSEPQES